MKIFVLLLIGIYLPFCMYAQGCSDAGFCSLGILKNNAAGPGKKYSIAIGANYGNGEQNTSSFNPYLEFGVRTNNNFSYQLKITSSYASGFLGSSFNAGDLFGFVSYAAQRKRINKISFLSGIKIPLSHSNAKNADGKPLPLDYQSSLGTFDLIAGINYISREKWELNAGIQMPVIHKNKNSFFPDEYTDSRVTDFSPTNNFRRKSDALIRISRYIFLTTPSISIKPNILAIYHFGEDTYENRSGKRENINGSDGLTVNAGIIATKRFKNSNDLELIVAAPFIVRDSRPDGLTRALVLNIQYRVSL